MRLNQQPSDPSSPKLGYAVEAISASLEKGAKVFGSTCLAMMVLIVALQVAVRYVFVGSISWSEEITRYLMIYMAFAGMSVALKQGAHVKLELLVERFPRKVRWAISLFINMLVLVFMFIVLWYSFIMVQRDSPQESPALQISMAIPLLAVPLGYILMSLQLILKIYKQVFLKEEA